MREQPLDDNPVANRVVWQPVILWVLLAVVVCSFCMLNYAGLEKARALLGDQPQEEKVSPEMVLMGRYCMGVKSVYTGFSGLASDSLSAGMLLQLKRSIRLPSDQVGLIPFIAEFASRDEVFRYIDELRSSVDLTTALRSDLDQFEVLYRSGATELAPDMHRQLVKRYRWIAQMAMTTGLPADHPERARAMKPAMRTFFTALVVFGVISIGSLTGCVLFILSAVLLIKKRIRFAFAVVPTSAPFMPYVFLEAAILFLSMTLLLGLLGRYFYPPVNWVLTISVAAAALFWPVWRGMSMGSMCRAIGWHKGKGLSREMGAGVVGYLAGIPLVACGCAATFFIAQHTGANPVHPIVLQIEDATIQKMIGMLVLACIMAPIVEETLFRGALYTHLRLKHSALWSALTSGFIFAVIHPQGFAALPALGAIAVVLAALREWRGSLIAPMMAHALNNLLATMVLVFAMWG